MMYSGHTYMTCLYALALIELVRSHFSVRPSEPNRWRNLALVWAVILFCLAEQAIELVLVLKNRFHYTMDVFMAILLTFLWFTSSPLCVAAKSWVHWPWTLPFHGVPHVDAEGHSAAVKKSMDKFKDVHAWYDEFGPNSKNPTVQIVALNERSFDGDIFVPECCAPFCCFPGNHHVVLEDHVYMADAVPGQHGLMSSP